MADAEIRFNQPRLLLVEGAKDIFFFKRLIQERNLPYFKVLHSGLNTVQGGNSLFARALTVLKQNVPSFNAVRHVVIVTDNDADQSTSFEVVRGRLEAKGHLPPDRPFERTAHYPTIEIVMLPLADEPGNLESTCIAAATSAHPEVAPHVDNFGASTMADLWASQQYAKMWLRSYLAVACERDPFVPLGLAFNDPPHHHLIDFQHASLTPIAGILEAYR